MDPAPPHPRLAPHDPRFAERIRASFARQALMSTLGASIVSVAPGEVVIELPFAERLTQQHGFLHAGAVASIVDSACGYAALSLMAPEAAVLSIEFKVNMLAPAVGDRFVASGRVVRAGRTITVCTGECVAWHTGKPTVVAVMQATMMSIVNRSGLVD